MLIAEINGVPASTHPLARLFVEQGFAVTALGLQARLHGTAIAGLRRGGTSMADSERGATRPRHESRDTEHDRIRSSNDRDQQLEREGIQSEHNRGYDEAVEGRRADDEETHDVDPDSAESEVDRDDTLDDY
jgi:hypothetical protein